MLEDGRVLEVENVVWCTGFATDYGWIRVPVLDTRGRPVHHRGVAAAAPGLYFAGLPFQSSLASHLVGGVGADARHITDQINGRVQAARRVRTQTMPHRRPAKTPLNGYLARPVMPRSHDSQISGNQGTTRE